MRRLHQLSCDDRRHWRNLAEIHADHCVHSQREFLHWHRLYLNYFERICGDVLGDPDFAVPYWDWTHGTGTIPDAFFELQALRVEYWNDRGTYQSGNWGDVDTIGIRGLVQGEGLQTLLDGRGERIASAFYSPERIDEILRIPDYDTFVSSLEHRPHDAIHDLVGTPPGTVGRPIAARQRRGHMFSGLSPLDPLFWLHHANVDRLWAQWELAGNRTPKSDDEYEANFCDERGQLVERIAADAASNHLDLGYTYEIFGTNDGRIPAKDAASEADAPDGPPELSRPEPLGVSEGPSDVTPTMPKSIRVETKELSAALEKQSVARDATLPPLETLRSRNFDKELLADFGRVRENRRRIFLRLRDVEFKFDVSPFVHVFVNHPNFGLEASSLDPHFAGAFAFFGSHTAHGEGHEPSPTFVVELTSVIHGFVDLSGLDAIDVQFVVRSPVPGVEVHGAFSARTLEIFAL